MSGPSHSQPATGALLSRGRRWGVRVLLVGATILAVVGIFAVWANRQVLNADNWSDTSTALLQDDAIRTQVSAFLVDQLYANVDVRGEVAAALPPRLDPLAGPASNALRNVTQRATEQALGRPRFQEAWRVANRATAQQFINVAEGKPGAVTASGNAVILDLRVILLDMVQRLGGSGRLVSKVPADAARVKIMSSEQVTTVQNGASALKGLALVLPALAIGMLGLAVLLARGRRRRTLLFAGLDFALAGVLVLVARNLIGDHVVNSLSATDAVKPAASAAWDIGTRMLRDVAQATIIAAVPVILAAVLAGPMRWAVAVRRAAAPWLRDRPDVAYGVLGALLLLVIAWGPIPATRKVIPVLVMIALAVVGMEALRRQTAEEFPDAHAGEAGFSVSATVRRARAVVTRDRDHNGQTGSSAAPASDRVGQLERLAALHARGALSDEEFAAEKAALRPPNNAAAEENGS